MLGNIVLKMSSKSLVNFHKVTIGAGYLVVTFKSALLPLESYAIQV